MILRDWIMTIVVECVFFFKFTFKKSLQNVKSDVCEVGGDREVKGNWL